MFIQEDFTKYFNKIVIYKGNGIFMKRIMLSILSVFMIFLFFIPESTNCQQKLFTMEPDSYGKSAYPGESVIFLWTIKNNDEYYTIDFHISSEPETEFDPTYFTLRPLEEQQVSQVVKTLKSDENGTIYDIAVLLEGEYYLIYPIPGNPNTVPGYSQVVVTILNESVEPEQSEPNYSFDNNGMIFGILSLIAVVAVFAGLILVYTRRGKK